MQRYLLAVLLLSVLAFAKEGDSFAAYLSGFDYKEREAMKISSMQLLNLVEEGKVQVIDIRFPEEYKSWRLGFAKNIPLNELPARLGELDKTKLIVTICPHNDRSALARHFLKLNGFNARYLSDGMLKTADYLRGGNARDFVEATAVREGLFQ